MKQRIIKKKHTVFCRLLSVCLALAMLSGMLVTVAGAQEGDGLTALSLSGTAVIEFDPAQTEYTAYLPQCYDENSEAIPVEVPTVTTVPADAQIDYPAEADGGVITVTYGGDVYTINLEVVGTNLLDNPSFEDVNDNTTPKSWSHNEGGALNATTTAAAHSGYGSYLANSYYTKVPYQRKKVPSGTKHLASMWARLDPDRTKDKAATSFHFERKSPSSASMSITAYENNVSKATSTTHSTNFATTLSDEWARYSTVFVSDKDDTILWFGAVDWTTADSIVYCADDYFLGELAAAGIKVYDESGYEISGTVRPLEGVNVINLCPRVVNQIGGTDGLEDVTDISFEFAKEYNDISLSEDGVLEIGREAPSSVAINIMAQIDIDGVKQTAIKDEFVLEIEDIPEEASYGLEDIVINGLSVPEFAFWDTNYVMQLPYSYTPNDFEVSFDDITVETYAVNEDAEVSYKLSGSFLTVTVEESDGSEYTYNIELVPVGKNLYADGGFEKGTSNASGTGSKAQVKDAAAAGSGSLKIAPAGTNRYATSGPTPNPDGVIANRKYLFQYMYRLYDTTGNPFEAMFWRDAFEGTIRFYDGDKPLDLTNVVVESEWKTLRALVTPSASSKPVIYFVRPTWDQNDGTPVQPPIVFDECYLGEVVVADMNYTGANELAIPESGETTTILSVDMVNQFGTKVGLEDEHAEWDLVMEYPGVYVDGDSLVITNDAREDTIRVRATVTSSVNPSVKFASTYPITLAAEHEFAEIPRANSVQIEGDVLEDQTLTGIYKYFNTKNIPEEGTTYRWLYSDSMTGAKKPIPDAEDITYVVEAEYADKYIFFEVTPRNALRDGTAAISPYAVKPTKPVAGSVSVNGGGYTGSTVKGSYVYSDTNGDKEGVSTYRWLRADSANGDYKPIDGATGTEYILTEDDESCYIAFEVTPVSVAEYETTGTPTRSVGGVYSSRPVATDLDIKKTSKNTYSVSYKYDHPVDIDEGNSLIQWYIDGDLAGTSSSQTVGSSDDKISVTITPIAKYPPYEGAPVSVSLTIDDDNDKVVSKKSGGSSGGSGASIIVPVPEVVPEPEVVVPQKHWAEDGINFVKTNGIMQEIAEGDFGNTRIVTRAEFIYYVMKTLGYKDSAYKHEFADVTGEAYYAGLLQTAVDMGIISRNDKFYPDSTVTREQICKILIEASGQDAQLVPMLDKFADKDTISEWARGYVGAASETKLLKGVSDTEFAPLGIVTREQTATILKRLYDYKNGGVIE